LKRIIFSVWSDLTDNHPSATEEKVTSFNFHKDKLIEKQKEYAQLCNSDYEIFTPDQNNYVDVQFYKLFQTENLLSQYDEVLYLDLDVIPKTDKVIFDTFNLDNVSVYQMPIGVTKWLRSEYLRCSERLPATQAKFLEALDDNLYPEELSSCWIRNNEVFLSYIIERYSVPNNDIGQPWNYILDHFIKYPTDACHFQHQVNKDFKI